MCFTIAIHLTRKTIEDRFRVNGSVLHDYDFNYFYRAFDNPLIPVIAQDNPSSVQLMQWGLIPSWSRDREEAEEIRKGCYNARAETLHEKPSFKEAVNKGRCLIVAKGFFEWQQLNGRKIPWYISLKNGEPFVFAGLCDNWRNPEDGGVVRSCSIITTSANPLMERIHNTKKRMPVLLEREEEKDWISGENSLLKRKQMLIPFKESDLKAHTINPRFISSRSDPADPRIIETFEEPSQGLLF
jgi:putative SOS response-associated peptidase YedK